MIKPLSGRPLQGADSLQVYRFGVAVRVDVGDVEIPHPAVAGSQGIRAADVYRLVGGNVDAGILNYQEAEAQIKAGEVRPLIVLSEKRQPAAPDVPTAKEIGVDYSISTVRGWMVRKGTPPERVTQPDKP